MGLHGSGLFFEGEGVCVLPHPHYGLLCWAIYPKLSSRDVKAWAMVWGGGFSGWDMGQRSKVCSVSVSLSHTHRHTHVPEGRGELEENVSSVVIFMEAIRSVQRLLQW